MAEDEDTLGHPVGIGEDPAPIHDRALVLTVQSAAKKARIASHEVDPSLVPIPDHLLVHSLGPIPSRGLDLLPQDDLGPGHLALSPLDNF